MAKTRALMTDTERERLAGLADVKEIKVYQAKSRVRRRIEEELTFDVEILKEHHPDLLKDLQEAVCEAEAANEMPVSDESQPQEQEREHTPTPDACVRGVSEFLDGVEFPSTKDRAECIEAVRAAYEYLQASETATMSEIVQEVMPKHPVGYDAESDIERINDPDRRNRSTWWRKVVKPGFVALPDVESPPKGGSDWTYTGGNGE